MPVFACRHPEDIGQATQSALTSCRAQYHQLALLVGLSPAQAEAATAGCCDTIHVGQQLATLLIEEPSRSRSRAAEEALRQAVAERPDRAVMLDRIEVLFEPSLQVNPLSLFRQLSRGRPVVVVWPGRLEGEDLVYAEPGHPEHYRAACEDFTVVAANTPDTSAWS